MRVLINLDILEYLAVIEKAPAGFLQEAQGLNRDGQKDKAQLQMNKKMVVEREVL